MCKNVRIMISLRKGELRQSQAFKNRRKTVQVGTLKAYLITIVGN